MPRSRTDDHVHIEMQTKESDVNSMHYLILCLVVFGVITIFAVMYIYNYMKSSFQELETKTKLNNKLCYAHLDDLDLLKKAQEKLHWKCQQNKSLVYDKWLFDYIGNRQLYTISGYGGSCGIYALTFALYDSLKISTDPVHIALFDRPDSFYDNLQKALDRNPHCQINPKKLLAKMKQILITCRSAKSTDMVPVLIASPKCCSLISKAMRVFYAASILNNLKDDNVVLNYNSLCKGVKFTSHWSQMDDDATKISKIDDFINTQFSPAGIYADDCIRYMTNESFYVFATELNIIIHILGVNINVNAYTPAIILEHAIPNVINNTTYISENLEHVEIIQEDGSITKLEAADSLPASIDKRHYLSKSSLDLAPPNNQSVGRRLHHVYDPQFINVYLYLSKYHYQPIV